MCHRRPCVTGWHRGRHLRTPNLAEACAIGPRAQEARSRGAGGSRRVPGMRRLPRHRRAPGRHLGKPAAHGGRVMPATGRLGRSPELRRRPVRPNRALSSWARSEAARARTWRRGGGAPGAPDRGVGPRLAGTTGPGAAGRGRPRAASGGAYLAGAPGPRALAPRARGGPEGGSGARSGRARVARGPRPPVQPPERRGLRGPALPGAAPDPPPQAGSCSPTA